MPDYSNSKLYALRSHQTDNIYIGSTTQALSERLRCHKKDYKSWLNDKHNYITSFEIIKYEDCYIELIKNCPCESKEQLLKIEGEEIRNNNCVNKIIAGRTKEEYIKDNEEIIKPKRKIYHEKNKEHRNEYRRNYGIINKEVIKEKKKEYSIANIDKMKKRWSDYYNDNKEAISEKRKQKVMCDCGKEYCVGNKSQHIKSNFHLKMVKMNKMDKMVAMDKFIFQLSCRWSQLTCGR